MEKIYDLFERYRDYILVFILFIVIASSEAFIYYYIKNDLEDIKGYMIEKKVDVEASVNKEEKKDIIYVDVKGEVSSPGVYSFEIGKRVIDAIKRAGGVTSKADTSINNLGKKLTDEMVVIVYSKNQVKNMSKIVEEKKQGVEKCNDQAFKDNSCLKESDITDKNVSSSKASSASKASKSTSKVTGKISINNASKEELMTLPGIGESKAKNIIEYRNKTKFNSIEDIKNVKGIGDSIFEKIKNNIEL